MRFSKVMGATLALGVVLGASSALASAPAGVWVKVQKVTYEPNSTSPTKIQIHGAAMLYDKSTGTSYTGYTEPALGYLYYECPVGSEKTCINEWVDVEKNASQGNDVCVGLGDQTLPTGTLRSSGSTPKNPDKYPIANGVLQGFTPCQVIEKFLLGQPDGGTDGGSGGTSGSGGSSSTGGAAGSGSGGASGGGGSSGAAGSGSGGASSGGASSGGASSGGASSGGASSGGASSGGASTGGKAGGDDSDDGGGCSLSEAPPTKSSLAWALGALGAAFFLRRRRS
ncbi:MAG: MYXO-CTERM sorting domain-containing protein [Polyangiaceae bacterium]